ncbi:ABC transporter ATP-binding protein [Methanobacterium congolense]|uniref:Putative ABC transporter ATP-binding protein YfiL n=1 Tax=Methanobacterium congolense TaxID=118062 RepID=A0A1D3L5A1_9EURY|nr:ABC transporter ATP-binding protein [Methanobacterium congolense]SCG86801.1 putative ABC transporter ATP-binding protein YfiL [Methanobacterium congolense]
MASEDVMIKIDSLTKSFGRIKALNDLNLEIGRGELLGIIGSNGAGKTTTIRIICCILKPDSGDVLVDGHSIQIDPIKIKSMIGYLPEEPNLYERFKARELLRYFAELYGVPKGEIESRIEELLELVGMSDRADDKINTFSKGLRQRVGIARALIHDPPIIIFDEPTMGLDPATANTIRGFIRKLKGKKTIILCTHYMDEAESLCDRVAIVNKGQIIDIGTPEYLESKVHGDIILKVRVNNPQSIDTNKIKNICSVDALSIDGNEFSVSLNSRKDISQIVDVFGEEVVSVNTKEPTLEDVFINTVK